MLKHRGQLIIADPWAPFLFRQLANLVNPLVGKGDVRMYGKGEMLRMLEGRRFLNAEWELSGHWGFVATARIATAAEVR